MHSQCFRKYGADRNGCAHVCGIGYALTLTVTCEHTEQLTLVESDPEMRHGPTKSLPPIRRVQLKKRNIFARGWKLDLKLPSIYNRRTKSLSPAMIPS